MNLEFIPVLYAPGHFGTWVSWLINQHSRFPKFECSPQNRDLPVQADIGSINSAFPYYKNLSDWDTYYLKCIDPVVRTSSNVNKFSFKFLHNQNFHKNDDDNDDFATRLDLYEINRIFSYIGVKKTVIAIVDNTLKDQIKKRWQYLVNDPDDTRAEYHYQWQLANISNYNNVIGSHLVLDVGKMLLGSIDEYKKLTEFIEEPPLDNFKDLSKSHYDFSFKFLDII